MNAVDFLDYEDAEAYDDNDEDTDEAFDESDEEARAGRRRRAVPTARGRGYTMPRVSRNYVTQPQLQASLSRVGADIRRNSAAIRTVGKRVDASNAKQDKSVSRLRGDLKRSSTMAMMMPLLMRPKTIKATSELVFKDSSGATALTIPKDTAIQTESSDSLTTMLPFLLLGGGLGGGDDGKGMDSTMMMLMMVLLLR